MAQTNDRVVAAHVVRVHTRGADDRTQDVTVLPESLTWSATLDPLDETSEIEITEDMVRRAIAQIDNEQIYPFRREADTPPRIARTVRRADVIMFPGQRA